MGGEYTFAVGKSFLLGRGRPSANISFGEKILTGNAMAIATLKHDGFTLIRVETTIQTEIPPPDICFRRDLCGRGEFSGAALAFAIAYNAFFAQMSEVISAG